MLEGKNMGEQTASRKICKGYVKPLNLMDMSGILKLAL